MISSIQNPKIKRIRLLQSQAKSRKKHKAFVIEGVRILEEALKSHQIPELVIFTSNLDRRGQQLLEVFIQRGVPCEKVSPDVLKSASDTETPQGILAVLPFQPLPLPANVDFLMIADEIRDPGNLGTLLRTSLAAGAQAMLLSPGTVDPTSPKVIRAGMGAHFRMPVLSCSWEEIRIATDGLTVFAADMANGTRYWDTDLTNPLGLLIGGEAHGPGKNARNLADALIHIPMKDDTESLNAAVSGAVLMYEVLRQRTRANRL